MTYQNAGVSITTADKLVDHLRTQNRAIGGFSGLYPLRLHGMTEPMLVASTDGVGTKLLVAKQMRNLSTIGIDLVAMVVNDLIVCGAAPLFFLDYYAMGKLRLAEAKSIIAGIQAGCKTAGMPLIGGETAEMPGLYPPGDFDLAGFGVGIVEKSRVIDGRRVLPGDLLYGFESSGLHSNGYSLARKALDAEKPGRLSLKVKELGTTLGSALMKPTRIYVNLMRALTKAKADIRGCAHITGGGIPGNLNRTLPLNADAVVNLASWSLAPLFQLIQDRGPVTQNEMLKTFNMGIGYIVVAPPGEETRIRRAAKAAGESCHVIGHITRGQGKVRIESREGTSL
ncbi:MAG: phosphoribosylformylglycinamidine cyclo-ligase [Candidatus Sumerlaeaceae bacterium]|nr:phosphoribosylformylglycinamidine cyclo-ligase [Candidatus Sumerlaeaceae bacterium]